MTQQIKTFLYSSFLAGCGIWAMPAHPDFWSAAGGTMFGMGLMGFMWFAPTNKKGDTPAADEKAKS